MWDALPPPFLKALGALGTPLPPGCLTGFFRRARGSRLRRGSGGGGFSTLSAINTTTGRRKTEERVSAHTNKNMKKKPETKFLSSEMFTAFLITS